MHEIIRKIHIPDRSRTGITEEREMFAKMESDRRAHAKRLRRNRLLSVLRLSKTRRR